VPPDLVIDRQVTRQPSFPLLGVLERHRIGPFLAEGLDKPLGLAVGARRVGPGSNGLEVVLKHRSRACPPIATKLSSCVPELQRNFDNCWYKSLDPPRSTHVSPEIETPLRRASCCYHTSKMLTKELWPSPLSSGTIPLSRFQLYKTIAA